MHKNNIFGKNSQSDAKKIMRKQLFPEKNSTELHSGNIVMMK